MSSTTETATTKQRLLRAGAELFAGQGFDKVSVRAICSQAGTSSNMVHHYFDSKQGLLDAVVGSFTERVFSAPLRVLDKQPRSREEFILRFELFFEETLAALVEQAVVVRVIQRHDIDESAMTRLHQGFVRFLEDAREQGFVHAEIEPSLVSGFLMDRLLPQVISAPKIKRISGEDLLGDADYRARWVRSNIRLLLYGLQGE